MRYWQVNTLENMAWNLVGETGIERVQETRVFHVKAKDVPSAIEEVIRYSGGNLIKIEHITSVQAI